MGGALIMAQIAWPTPWVVIIGSFLSTSGAAIQSLVGQLLSLQYIFYLAIPIYHITVLLISSRK